MILISQLARRKGINILIVLSLLISNGCVQNPEKRYQKGADYFKKKMWDKAIVEFNKALQINPSNAKVYLVRGNSYGQKGLYDQAIVDYNKAIEINPSYAEAYTFRGDAYGQKGLYDRTISDCNKAIEINPSYGGAYIMRAYAYYHTEKYDKALEDINKAESLGEQTPSLLQKVLQKIQGLRKTENENKISEKEVRQIPVSLEGIFVDASGKNSAIINGKVVFEGDSIGDIKVDKINRDSVDIVVDGQKRNIKLGQGETKSVEAREGKQDTKLKEAISVENLEEAVKLIEEGRNVDTTDERGRTALMIAASGGEMDKEYLKLLLSKGANVNTKDQNGTTALHLAVVFGSKETVGLLYSKGADVNAKDKFGKTPLTLAEESGKREIIELLRSK